MHNDTSYKSSINNYMELQQAQNFIMKEKDSIYNEKHVLGGQMLICLYKLACRHLPSCLELWISSQKNYINCNIGYMSSRPSSSSSPNMAAIFVASFAAISLLWKSGMSLRLDRTLPISDINRSRSSRP
jgi:hypothetical protein